METKFIKITDGKPRSIWSYIKAYFLILAIFASLFLPGLLANNTAMQWAGFIVLMLLLSMAGIGATYQKKTIAEAREFLDELENEASK